MASSSITVHREKKPAWQDVERILPCAGDPGTAPVHYLLFIVQSRAKVKEGVIEIYNGKFPSIFAVATARGRCRSFARRVCGASGCNGHSSSERSRTVGRTARQSRLLAKSRGASPISREIPLLA